jgi:signal transduction histidine kinase
MIRLRGQSLYEFAREYSLWDAMVDFLRSGDRAWAAVNIDASLPNFGAQAAWVLRADGTIHYIVTVPGQSELADVLPREPAFLERLRTAPEQHFFARSASSLVEIRTAPILPSEDIQRQQKPRGWLAVARRWDAKNLESLAVSLRSRVTFDVATLSDSAATIQLTQPLNNWQGAHLATLHLSYFSPSLDLLLDGNDDENRLLYAFGTLNFLAIALVSTLWFIRPVQLLNRSLASGQRETLVPLISRSDEFGDVAKRLAGSFIQRDALQESEARLLHSIELRARLARDLHDGIIQSIYAAGLGLESLTKLRATDPVAADRRLASCQQMLNETLWQVRNFIGALEPESDRRQTTSQSITTLAASLQALQSVPIALDVDQAAAARVSPTQELQLLRVKTFQRAPDPRFPARPPGEHDRADRDG